MKNTIITLGIALLISMSSFAQQGINYKALIKDASGNVMAGQTIDVRFTIIADTGPTDVYTETHPNVLTDANGIIILNIGEGTPVTNTFASVDWRSDTHSLKTEIDTEQDGAFEFMSTTLFSAVPYAKYAETAANVTGLERVTDSIDSGTGLPIYGWRLVGQNPAYYGNIGKDAVDLSYSLVDSSLRGATGIYSTAMGYRSIASGAVSTAMGSFTNASGAASTAMGYRSIASGDASIAMGNRTSAPSFAETAIGSYNTDYTQTDSFAWSANDRLFVIGNGTNSAFRNDALTVLKNGTITAPSLSIAEINTAGDKALITKEYADSEYLTIESAETNYLMANGDISIDGEIQHTSTGNANMIPIAYGTVDSNGDIVTGTGNFTAFLSGNVFIIDVNDTEALNYNNTVCLITPISTASRTSSTTIADGNGDNDADLNVRIFNASGTQVATTFQFVIYKL